MTDDAGKLRAERDQALTECERLRDLLADVKFYLQRQDVRAIGGVVCVWDIVNPALQERIDSATKKQTS